jgi:hypothetical protein
MSPSLLNSILFQLTALQNLTHIALRCRDQEWDKASLECLPTVCLRILEISDTKEYQTLNRFPHLTSLIMQGKRMKNEDVATLPRSLTCLQLFNPKI